MKPNLLYVLFLYSTILTSCNNDFLKRDNHKQSEKIEVEYPIPVNYDFEHLKLYLNSSIKDSTSKVAWRWDYLTSDNGWPDSTGIDYFMNHEQALFTYNDETTLPSLSIKTNKNRIIVFSVTVIFHLPDSKPKSIENLLDSLPRFDLLKDTAIKQSIIEHGKYKSSNTNFEETIELKVSEEKYEFDAITYEIKNKT